MSDFVLSEQHSLTSITIFEARQSTYPLAAAAQMAEVHPDLVRYYCRAGLLGEVRAREDQEPFFDDDALYELRRIEHYRRHHGVNLHALPLVMDLLHEVERLRAELGRQR